MHKKNFILLAASLLLVASCGQQGQGVSSTASNVSSSSSLSSTSSSSSQTLGTYSIHVKNVHGKGIKGATLSINGKEVTTDGNGKASFTEMPLGEYPVTAVSLPDGYSLSESLSVTSFGDYSLSLDSSIITGKKAPKGTTLGIGDLAYDYSFEALDYNEKGEVVKTPVTLSEKLKTNDFVAINFFFVSCSWCSYEAPYLVKAYEKVKDNGGYMIGADFYDVAKNDKYVIDMKKDDELNYDVAFDYSFMYTAYQIDSCPTTVIIDRYGFISFFYRNYFNSEKEVSDVFSSFMGDDYKPILYKNNSLMIDETK